MGFTGRQPEGGADPVADQAGDLGQVWNRVIGDLSGAAAGSGAPPLSPQQRAFLRLTRPLGLIDGTALLAAPSEFAKDAIERILRRPISDALGRHLGVTVNLAVVVDASAASGGTEVPDPPGPEPVVAAPERARVGSGPATRSATPARSGWPAPEPLRERRPAAAPGRAAGPPTRARPPPSRAAAALADPPEREVHLRHVRHRRVEPVRHAAAVAVAEAPARSPTTRCSSGATPGWARPTCCTPSATTRSGCSRACACATCPPRSSPTTSSTPCATTARSPSSAATATSTCCWSTTSSSWRARKAPRRSSSTPSTRCTTRTSRSSSPPTGRRSGWRPWRTGCAPGSSGA